jgi:hypothetical protein
MTVATQFVTIRTAFSYNIIHPSNADIRFIASDNSTDSIHVLRISGDNSSGNRGLTVSLGGSFVESFNKTYEAAFGIVNEENFSVDITHINVSTYDGTSDYLQIWLHGDRDQKTEDDASSVMVWNKGSIGFSSSDTVWRLGAGNNNPINMNTHATLISTPWNETAHVRYSFSDIDAINGTDDYVWVQISLDIPSEPVSGGYSGLIWIHFRATTQ